MNFYVLYLYLVDTIYNDKSKRKQEKRKNRNTNHVYMEYTCKWGPLAQKMNHPNRKGDQKNEKKMSIHNEKNNNRKE